MGKGTLQVLPSHQVRQYAMNHSLITILSAAFLPIIAGCSTTTGTAHQATVCPDCRTVMVEVEDLTYSDVTSTTVMQPKHECPGCRGALETLFKEGRFQHECSICKSEGYTCPVSHRIASS